MDDDGKAGMTVLSCDKSRGFPMGAHPLLDIRRGR
jgi:hypothetical protein